MAPVDHREDDNIRRRIRRVLLWQRHASESSADDLDSGDDEASRPSQSDVRQRTEDDSDSESEHSENEEVEREGQGHGGNTYRTKAAQTQGIGADQVFSALNPANAIPAVASLLSLPSPPPLLPQFSAAATPTAAAKAPITLTANTSPHHTPTNAPLALNPQAFSAPSSNPTSSPSSAHSIADLTPFAFESSATKSSPSPIALSGATAALQDNIPFPTIFITDTDGVQNGRDTSSNNGGMSPIAEDILISAGSIGAFILISFVCWMGWGMMKASKKKKRMGQDDHERMTRRNTIMAKIPYFGRNQQGWEDLDGGQSSMRSVSPMYDQTAAITTVYTTNDPRFTAQTLSKQSPVVLPQLQTNLSYSGVNPFSASTSDTLNPQSAQSTQPMHKGVVYTPTDRQNAVELPGPTPNATTTVFSNPFQSPEDYAANNDVVSSQSSAQNGTMESFVSPQSSAQNGTMESFNTTTTERSRMPDAYYNQSELARQPSYAYDPAKRAVYRASELSSISSGFGDGDIIVPPPAALNQDRPYSYANSRKNSVAARSDAGSNGNRDTMYTATSEDMPARYRSVNSWVNQQTGRVQRQQERESEDVPPVPSLPPEQRLTMMMDDGEEPRRYEDTLTSQPPVPAVPSSYNTNVESEGR